MAKNIVMRVPNGSGEWDDLYPVTKAGNVISSTGASAEAHMSDKSNPHDVTKAQVGLGSVSNYGLATKAEAEAGTSSAKYMTPLRTKEAIVSTAIPKGDKGVAGGVATLNASGKVVDASGNEVEWKVTSVNGQTGDVNLATPILKGSASFRSMSGAVIPHTIGHTDYIVLVTPSQNPHGYLGEVWVERADNSFKVSCSGSSTTGFDYLVFDVSSVEMVRWFDFTFRFYEETPTTYGRIRRYYETTEITIPFDCTLYVKDDKTQFGEIGWVDWKKNGVSETMYYDTILMMPSMTFKQGDKLSLELMYVYHTTPEELGVENYDSVVDFEIYLDPEYTQVVANPYFEFVGASCYLSTAMVRYYGKDDDGKELESMRALRYKFKDKHNDVLSEYSHVSPYIIRGIEQSENPEYWYNEIKVVVDEVVALVDDEQWEEAETAYLNLYRRLKDEFYN